MDRQTKRYLITWSIVLVSMFTTLGIVLYQARHQVRQADSVVVPTQTPNAEGTQAPPATTRSEK